VHGGIGNNDVNIGAAAPIQGISPAMKVTMAVRRPRRTARRIGRIRMAAAIARGPTLSPSTIASRMIMAPPQWVN
jgi:hypothetical protein